MDSRNVGRNAQAGASDAANYAARGGATGVVHLGLAFSMAKFAAGGLDAAFHTIAAQPFGAALLVVTAIGFALYGYCSCAREIHERDLNQGMQSNL